MIARNRACSFIVPLVSFAALACAHTPTSPAVVGAAPATTTTTATAVAAPPSSPVAAPLSLVPSNMARPMLVASFVVSSLDHSLENAVSLVHQASPIPIDAAGARELLLAQIGLPSEIARHLDLRAPVAGAAVAGRPGTTPLMAFAMTAKSGPDVQAVLAAAGGVIARRGAALQIQAKTGEKGWFLPLGNVLLVADGEDALTMAGSLALEGAASARNDAGADLSITVYPDVLARAMGTTVPAELERVVTALDGQRAATTGDGATNPAARARPAREVAGYLAGAVSVELAVNLDAGRGLGVTVRLAPRPGSKLEILAREVPGAMPDLRIAGGKENPGALIVSAYDKRNLEPIRRMREALSTSAGTWAAEKASKEASKSTEASKMTAASRESGATVAGQFLDALLDGLSGGMSSTFRMRPLLSGEIVYAGKAGGGAGLLSTSLLRLGATRGRNWPRRWSGGGCWRMAPRSTRRGARRCGASGSCSGRPMRHIYCRAATRAIARRC